MRRKAICMVVAIFILFLVHDAHAKRPLTVKVGEGDTVVSFIAGCAEVMPTGTTEWNSLGVNSVLVSGDQVRTQDKSRIEITLPDQSVLRFAENTRFRVIKMDVSTEMKKRNVNVDVILGRTWANVSKTLGVTSSFELSSENAVAGVRGTIYRMNVYEDKSALVRVYDGEVAVSGGGEIKGTDPLSKMYTQPHKIEGPKPVPGPRRVSMEEWTYIIRSMQQIRIRADGVAETPRSFSDAEDKNDWVDWNRTRDNIVKR